MKREFEMELHCGHCDKDTLHKCVSAGHERDSSYDCDTCQVCGWYKHGMSSEYEPPDSEGDDD